MKTKWMILGLCVATFACSKKEESAVNKYPETQKVDTVDTYFGEAVADPYRWLENDTTKETSQWVKSQNDVTFGYLNSIPYRDKLRKRIEALNDYEKLSAPFKEGEYFYYYRNSGLQNHSVLYRRKGEKGEPEIFLDPNTFSKDGTTRLAGVSFSKDGSLCAYQISKGGADWTEAIVIKASDKTVLEDTIHDIKFSGISWKGNEGFYFSTYDKPKGSQLSAKTQNHKLFYHKLKTPRAQDVLVFGGDQTPRRYIGAYLTEDERFLVVTAATSTTGNELYVQDLSDPKGKLVTLVGNFDSDSFVLANEGSRLLIHTNWRREDLCRVYC
jgi:prolyl oligopeptidase